MSICHYKLIGRKILYIHSLMKESIMIIVTNLSIIYVYSISVIKYKHYGETIYRFLWELNAFKNV